MSIALAVVGAGFGDEGKGLMTDYLVRRYGASLVARFNGGAQAGHTVEVMQGARHVFGHVGSGTFAGANTFLGPEFIVNPYLFETEYAHLASLGYRPEVLAWSRARVTTVFDMAINAAIELSRGSERHGSCGVGINETVTRHEADDDFQISLEMIKTLSSVGLARRLRRIAEEWVPSRLQVLGLDEMPEAFHLKTGGVLINTDYEAHARKLYAAAQNLVAVTDIDHETGDIGLPMVLEGAQGLMLDEFLGTFPHVTRSMTGLPNAINVAADLCYEVVQPIYMTRAYATRHGAGMLKHQDEVITTKDLYDYTNRTNDWQGSLRYAPLDLAELKRFIDADLERGRNDAAENAMRLRDPVIGLTCLDQLGDKTAFYDARGNRVVLTPEEVPGFVTGQLGYKLAFTSHGPTYRTVVQHAELGI